jgi:hypothetical protein
MENAKPVTQTQTSTWKKDFAKKNVVKVLDYQNNLNAMMGILEIMTAVITNVKLKNFGFAITMIF